MFVIIPGQRCNLETRLIVIGTSTHKNYLHPIAPFIVAFRKWASPSTNLLRQRALSLLFAGQSMQAGGATALWSRTFIMQSIGR